jgi:hypothetical protein
MKPIHRPIARWFAAVSAISALSALAIPASACPNCVSTHKPGTYTGEAYRIGNGIAYSWVTLDAKGKPSSIGVTLTETAMEGLPEKGPNGLPFHGFNLSLPKEADKTAFDHIGVDWNPKGHDPSKVYDIPHFDIHFYTIPVEARMKITAQGADIAKTAKTVPAAFAPQGYIYAKGTEVPMMGGHWVDPKAPELNGERFTKTFLYGSYNGDMIFYEPMLTREWLQTKPTLNEDIKVAASYKKSGYYPTRYTVRYDEARKEYTVALEGLVWREAANTKPTAGTVSKPAATKTASKATKK